MSKEYRQPEEKCINCAYCRNLSLLDRQPIPKIYNNIISGLKIEKKNINRRIDSLVCIARVYDDVYSDCYETLADDICEMFKLKVEDIDNSSLIESNMICRSFTMDNIDRDKMIKIIEERVNRHLNKEKD